MSTSTASAVVWIVDDSRLEAEMAQAALGPHRRCEIFADGEAMLERLSVAAPDVVLLDCRLPGISGIEVTEFVRGTQATRHVPIVMLTGLQDSEDVVRGLAAGANGYVTKPFSPAELAARVDAVVRTETLRARAERAEATLVALLEQLPEALVATDEQGLVRMGNAPARRLFAPQVLVGRPISEHLPAIDLGALACGAQAQPAVQDVAIGGAVFAPAVRRFELPDGDAGYLVTLRDITAERALEHRRLDFYSIIAHDLRGPLNAISLRTQRILSGLVGGVPETVSAELRRVLERVGGMAALIDDFLDLARIEGAGLPLDQGELDLPRLVAELVEDARVIGEARGVRVTASAPASLALPGDERRVRQAVMNLLSNAVKFSPDQALVEVEVVRDGDRAVVRVTDRGPGIDEITLAHLFRRYTRARSASGVSGTGLGLLIVREIVEAHGGEVGATSTVGQGSTFWLRLPAAGGGAA